MKVDVHHSIYVDGEYIGTAKQLQVNEYTLGASDIQITLTSKPTKPKHVRPEWDKYFLGIADAVSKRGDCSRRQVGAVVVDCDRRIAGTGYNGTPPGKAGCLELPCERTKVSAPCPGYSDCRSVHAETNALLYSDREACIGGVLYITEEPCEGCLKLIGAAQIYRVVWPKGEMKL